jgi:autotransporter-associated beta strand protein
VSSDANLGAIAGGITLNGGVFKVTGNAFASTSRIITLGSTGGGFDIAAAANRFTVGQTLGGVGALSVAGAGTLVLTGANTYTGGTTINAGTLQLGNGSTTGSIIGNVTNNGTLIFDRSDALTFAGTIAGNGAVVKKSSDTLIFTGNNTYTGDTTINAGTLEIGNGGTSGSITGNVANNGTLTFDRSDATTFAGAISGAGSVTQRGTGTLIVTGANNYAGGTTISAGTLQIGNGGTTGSINGNIDNNGALVFNRSDAVNFSGTISGSGSLTQQGTGTLIVTSANTYAGRTLINGGALALSGAGSIASSSNVTDNGTLDISATASGASIASLDGSGTVNLGSRTLTLATASGSFSGVINGSGGLSLQSGSETLTGANTFIGTTTINSDSALTLGNGGSLASDVVNNGTLAFEPSGTSTFADSISGNGVVLQNGSGILILDGNSASFKGNTSVQSGTLEVGDASTPSAVLGGNVAVAGSGTLRGHGIIGGNVTNSGTVWAGGSIGTLTIQGNYTQTAQGVLEVEATPGGQASLLAINGSADLAGSALVLGENGDWAARTNYTILTANGGVNGQFASASSNFAFLAPTLSYTSDGVSLALERNQLSFASLAQTPNEAAVANAIDLTGFNNPVYNAVVMLDAQAARSAFDQLSGEIHASTRTAIMDDEHTLRDAVTNHLLGWNGDAGGQEGRTVNDTAVWTAAWARDGDEDGNGNASTLNTHGGGMLLGLDVPVSDAARLGGVIGLGDLSSDISPLNASAQAQTRHVGLYGSLQKDGFRLIGGAFYGWQDLTTHRDITVAGLAGSAKGNYDANTLQGYLDGSYVFAFGRGTLAPFVNAAAQRLHTDAFTETGTPAALSAGAQDTTQTYGTLGLRGSVKLDSQGVIQAHASLGWQHAWGELDSATTLRLASSSPDFTVDGVPVARNAAAVSVGFRFFSTPHFSADASYGGQFASHARDQSARLSLSYAF